MNNDEQNTVRLEESLRALKRAMASSRERLSTGLNLTRTQLEILLLIAEKPNQTTSELVTCLSLTQGAITQTVDTLERRKLVCRTQDEHDRRLVRLSLSPTGQDLTRRLSEARRNYIRDLASSLSESELSAMITATKRITELLDDHREQNLTEGSK